MTPHGGGVGVDEGLAVAVVQAVGHEDVRRLSVLTEPVDPFLRYHGIDQCGWIQSCVVAVNLVAYVSVESLPVIESR